MAMKIRLLIVVKTYPLPSESYQEIVCTAGVLADGTFIRLHPIDYRYRPYWQWYKKYQWIEVEVEKNQKDPRKESYRPKVKTIRLLGPRIPTERGGNWDKRREYVLAKEVQTMCGLQDQKELSLGIIRPKIVKDFIIEPTERDWKPKWKKLFIQQRLFGPQQKPLEKIPFNFSYVFECEHPGCNGRHKMMIVDWETGRLFLQMRDKFGDEGIAAQKVKDKFFGQMCAPDVDTHFFVGTHLQYRTWLILGVFWPKKRIQ